MLKRIFVIIFLTFLLISCSFFQKKEFAPTTVIDTVINYHSIDVFPLFPSCDSIPSQEKQKICTQIKLSEHMYASLKKSNIVAENYINDTIFVKLKIDKKGLVSLSNLQATKEIQQQLPNLDSLINDGIKNLPILKPAIKRGIPVTTEFTLPIVVKN